MTLELRKLLNGPQFEAATITSGPVCIVAGAGSGKTRVITHRLAFLVQEGLARPEQLLAVTFTNKAARELKERVEKLLPGSGGRLWVSTFHSAAARILREAHTHVGLPRSFSVYDQDDAEKLIKTICGELNIATDLVRGISHRIEQLQHNALSPEQFETEPFDVPGKRVREVYRLYMDRLRAAGAVDFGGLIVLALKVIREKPEASYSLGRVTHAVVDEYQDVNAAQSSWVEALAPRLQSLAVVGDDDQSIYRWRGASSQSLLRFTATFKNARQVRLEENYRSCGRVLALANEIIRGNKDRMGKELWTRASLGEPIRIRRVESEREEADVVVRDLAQQMATGKPGNELAVLYRTNAQSRPLEEALNRYRVAYRLVGGVRFYDRREVKDVLAYARLLVNPDSEMDLRRVINVPPRAIGDKTVDALALTATWQKLSLGAALDLPDEVMANAGVKPAARTKLKEFATVMRELRTAAAGQLPSVVLTEIVARTNYDNFIRVEEDADERLANLEQLQRAAQDYEEDARREGEEVSLAEFLERAALQSEADGKGTEAKQAVTLMTLHAAKGLEFDGVYLVGAEENVLPSARAINSGEQEELNEERRLCYVGVTRARDRLTITMARRRMVNGQLLDGVPSRFLRELPAEFIRGNFNGNLEAILPRSQLAGLGLHRNFGTAAAPAPVAVDRGSTRVEYDDAPPARRTGSGLFSRSAPRRDVELMDVDLDADDVIPDQDDGGGLRKGSRVKHPQYGPGAVVGVSGSGPDARVDVEFPGTGTRRIVARFLRPG